LINTSILKLEISKNRSKKSGLPAGSLIHIGHKKVKETNISLIDYGKDSHTEQTIKRISQCFPYKDDRTITWINIDGLHDVRIMEELGTCFGFHPLTLEDVLNTDQRPKLEDFGDYIYIVLKMIELDKNTGEISIEQVSIIFGKNFLVSFQEQPLDIYIPLRNRLRDSKSAIRKEGSDFLAYQLIDLIVDNYFKVLEYIGERIEKIENKLVLNPTQKTLKAIHGLKREMLFIRKSVWPLREVISNMERGHFLLIKKPTGLYIRDIYDHTIQIIDTVEIYRDMLSGMVEIYLSSMSNKLNEIMKVLTIFASIFIPITFIASMFGMNFKYMPELDWRWSYPAVWAVMIGIGVFLILYFKRKKWF